MTRKSKRIWKRSIGLLLITTVLAWIVTFLPHERRLMRQARWITSVNNDRKSPCLWLSDRDVILMPYHADGDRFEFARFGVGSGKQTPIDVLNHKYHASLTADTFNTTTMLTDGTRLPPATFHIAPEHSISPDGKWLIFSPLVSIPRDLGLVTYIATTLDGKHEIRWHSEELACAPLWLHDNRHWLRLVLYAGVQWFPDKMILYDVNDPRVARRISIKGAVAGESVIGITGSDRLLQMDLNLTRIAKGPTSAVKMAEYSLLSPPLATNRYTIRLPKPCYVRAVVLSPRGDRLAWLFLSNDVPPDNALLHRLMPSIPLRPQRTVGLWVSNLDGTNMTEIGHQAALPRKRREQDVDVLQWLPGGKRVSFVYQGALYTVDVPYY